MAEVLKTVLLLALPASGKSEVRRYLAQLSPEECTNDFHMGPTVQLDDFPYVHMMRRIDDELAAQGKERVFFEAPDRSFRDPLDWGTLVELLNEDYVDMVKRHSFDPPSAGRQFMKRLDAASERAGLPRRLAALGENVLEPIVRSIEKEAGEMLIEKTSNYPETLAGKTLVIEFARGGPQGSSLPLPKGFGYRHSLAALSDEILENATVLYIWVTPEESRRKNEARTDPNDPGSILHHGVPLHVMLNDYGTDDMDDLEEKADRPGTITVNTRGKTFHLPIARFDNRVDKTSFIREEPSEWSAEDVKAVHDGLKNALQKLAHESQ